MDPKQQFEKLVHYLQLGQKLVLVEPILGGALHNMWKLTTDTGVFAVKEINSHISKKETFPHSYEVSEEVATRFSQNGIPAISANKIHDRFVHHVDEHWYLIYPYYNAQVCQFEALTEEQLQRVGSIFAGIHNLNIRVDHVDTAHYDYFDDQHWLNIIQQSASIELLTLLNFILDCNQQYKKAINRLKANQVVTHRDLHSLNVLWDEKNQPYIIDWETAGLMDPLLEVVGYGIEWGGIIQGSFKKLNTQILFQQYKRERNQPIDADRIRMSFQGWIGHCVLGWTEFNIRRMLGQTSRNQQEHKIGEHIIKNKMIPCIQYISTNHDMLLDLAIKDLG
ncbi:MAG: aminoglycoside phosphotransferase family protein [Candidatus Berkiella sp.]